ncbi:MAG: sugar phosphate isomerase/epimerase [Gammaproteobacteria bacterium]|nr:sugar phosphate isomerase/epimerase [Gammaproteobacteria bacterium]
MEFAGVFGKYEQDPKALKAFLQKQGLVVSGAHVGFDKLTQDKIDATLSFYKTLGANYLIIPWDDRSWQPDGVMEVVNELNELLPQINASGLAFGYHNHAEEFNEFKSQTYWDYIAQNTDENMVLQLDIGWVNFAGKDPIHYVKEYEGRTLTTHYKVRTHDGLNKDGKALSPIIGEDGYDWTELFNVMKEFGGTKWIILEQEEYPNGLTSVEAVEQSKQGLDKLLSEVNRK